jgi:hypothetical protein
MEIDRAQQLHRICMLYDHLPSFIFLSRFMFAKGTILVVHPMFSAVNHYDDFMMHTLLRILRVRLTRVLKMSKLLNVFVHVASIPANHLTNTIANCFIRCRSMITFMATFPIGYTPMHKIHCKMLVTLFLVLLCICMCVSLFSFAV